MDLNFDSDDDSVVAAERRDMKIDVIERLKCSYYVHEIEADWIKSNFDLMNNSGLL